MSQPDTTARDLLSDDFAVLGTDTTLREVARRFASSSPAPVPAVLFVNEDGTYAGMLTLRLLLRALARETFSQQQTPPEDEQAIMIRHRSLLQESALDHFVRDVPVLSPEDRLPRLIERASRQKVECLPVLEHGKPLGIVHIAVIFEKAAGMALTPDTTGIQLP